MGYRRLVRNLRLRGEHARRLIPGFDRRWILEGPNAFGIVTAVHFDTAEVICFRMNADGTAELMADNRIKGNSIA